MTCLTETLSNLEAEKSALLKRLQEIDEQIALLKRSVAVVDKFSPVMEKVKLYQSLFQGRSDVYARRFESAKTGKSGYQPVCKNEWVPGVCNKPKVKCGDCSSRCFLPMTATVIENHLRGEEPCWNGSRPFVAGIYPLLEDDSCKFLAVDFDDGNWLDDAGAFMSACKAENVFASLERSRSGCGGHVWIFFDECIPAKLARELGSALMTKALDLRPQIGMNSFDRFFPNQDYMPKGGLGNLIALPLQKKAREKNHSSFINPDTGDVYEDQWAYLSSIQKIGKSFVEDYVFKAKSHREILPVTDVSVDDDEPWKNRPSYPEIKAALPQKINITISNQIFIESAGLPALLRNRILRLASFQNPEFYQAQALRLPVWGKPRILYCYDFYPKHIAIPVGCIDKLIDLLQHYNIEPVINDERNCGQSIDVSFEGNLYPEQLLAAEALLKHENGILSATTAFGKTVVALWLIAKRKVNTLILVHRTQLMDQWVERICAFLNVSKKEIGQFSGTKKKHFGKIDVALISSVYRDGKTVEWLNEYGQVIVDECHHISAFSFEQAVRQSNALYKVGLSATLSRKDGQHPIVMMNLGQVRYSVSAKKQATERDFSHSVIVRNTDFRLQNDAAKLQIQEVFNELWQDEKRNELIAGEILQAYKEHRQILVLSERTEHLDWFYERLHADVEHLFVLKGGMGKKQLKRIMEEINDSKIDSNIVILATGRYIGEGFDLKELDTLFLPFPISWKGTLAQYVGRLHRESVGKTEVRVYDYVDGNVPVLTRMHQKRVKGYEALGYKLL